jgi:DnaJ-domain-containing protein 1
MKPSRRNPRRASQRAGAICPEGETREEMIREAAYRLAKQRGFEPGHELEDWLAAERQIDYWMVSGGGVVRPVQHLGGA